VFYDLTDMSRKLQRIAIANITGQVQLKGQNVVFCNALAKKIALKQISKQIGLAASANAGDHLYLTIPHKGDDLLQVSVSFYFHVSAPVENLLVLSCYFSIDIIRGREGKINDLAEKFTNKPDNISTKQVKRYTTIQLDIIHTGDCLKILKTLPDDSVHCCVTSPPYYALRDYGMEAQIGGEISPKEYISRLMEVFTEVRRVLCPDGTLWLNISDTYAGKGNQGDFVDPKNPNGRNGQAVALNNKVEGCKAKDMIGIPWMLAFALRDTGWYLRGPLKLYDLQPVRQRRLPD